MAATRDQVKEHEDVKYKSLELLASTSGGWINKNSKASESLFVAAGVAPPALDRNAAAEESALGLLVRLQIIGQGALLCLSYRIIVMVILTGTATFICSRAVLNLRFGTEMSIFSYGSVFPLTFGIAESFKYREGALEAMGKIKASVVTFYMHMAGWEKESQGEVGKSLIPVFQDMLRYMEMYCRNPDIDQGLNSEESLNTADHYVYDCFATLAAEIERLSPTIGYLDGKGGLGGKSRVWEALRGIMKAWESLRITRDYRSPRGLRKFCFFIGHLSPIALAPYWLSFCSHESSEMDQELAVEPLYGCVSGYFVGVMYVIVVMALTQVHDGLDNPFEPGPDQVGWKAWRQQLSCLTTLDPNGPYLRFANGDMNDEVKDEEE